jgi:DNA-3-methyladenine glycosylase II
VPPVDPKTVGTFLARSDPYLSAVIRHVGALPLPRRPGGFRALARSIIYQQISGAAGAAIVRRLESADGAGGRFPGPEWFLGATPFQLRAAGLSPQKIAYMKDLARRVVGGELDFDDLRHRTDEEVIARLGEVHGVGRWTAQMYLLFHLRRPDVWPIGDLGVRKAVQRMRGMAGLPSDRTMERVGRPWRPYRSYAAFYLWRSLEHPAELFVPPAPRSGAGLSGASRRSATLPARSPRGP